MAVWDIINFFNLDLAVLPPCFSKFWGLYTTKKLTLAKELFNQKFVIRLYSRAAILKIGIGRLTYYLERDMVSIYPKLNWRSSQTWCPCPVFYFWLNGTAIFRPPSLDPVTGQIPFINPSYFWCHPSPHSHLPPPSPRPTWVHSSLVLFPPCHSSCCLLASCRFLSEALFQFSLLSCWDLNVPCEWFSLQHAPESPGGLAALLDNTPRVSDSVDLVKGELICFP